MTTTGDPYDPQKNPGVNPNILRQNIGKNLLAPGSGTYWEDRGSLGLPAAYLKTVFSMLFFPGRTTEQIKRLEYRKDAFAFVIASAIPWFFAAWIHSLIHYFTLKGVEVDPVLYFARTFAGSVILGGGMVLMFNTATRIYFGMVNGEDMKGRGTPELIYNAYAYCLAPSLLAIIPFVGPIAAIVWGFVLSVKVGIGRLRVKPGGAATASSIATIAGLLVVLGTLAAGYLVWNWTLGTPYINTK